MKMQNLGRVLLIVILSMVGLMADSVEATVNTQEVVKGNPVQLRIKAVGKSAAFPNIHQINGEKVTSSGTSKSSSMRITTRGMESETQTTRTYIFVPNRDMVIPSYTINISGTKYTTEPIEIKVVDTQAPGVQGNADFSFVLKTDKKSVQVGESFVVTLYISVSSFVSGAQIGDFVDPSSQDFFLKAIEGQKEYQANNASVIEKRYIVTAKKEGNFTIAPASAKLGQPDRNRQDIFGRYDMRWTAIASNTLEVEVKAQAKDTDLVGDFNIDAKLDTQTVKTNKPVNLTVKIEGQGSLEDFEFPSYEIEGVTIYSDKAKVESSLVGDELRSTYSKSFAFIAEEDFVIPKRTISVYDPNTKEEKFLEVEEHIVSVEGKKVSTTPLETSPVQTNIVQTLQIKDDVVEKNTELKSIEWWIPALAFTLGGLCMYLLRFIPKLTRKSEKRYKESDALKILYAHMSDNPDVEAMVRKLYAKKNGDKSVKIDKKELKKMVERFR